MPQDQNVSTDVRPILSVVIPTYNRPMELARTLKVLLPQARLFGIPVCILDNASTVAVEKVMESFQEFRDLVEIIRNRVNIGANANLCRCFETCKSEWMWMLGDDDIPDDNCISKILSELNELGDRVCYINFSCKDFRHPQSLELEGLTALSLYINDRSIASNILFISAGLFRAPPCQKNLIVGCQNTYTCAPHLAILFTALASDQYSCKVSTSQIVEYVPPNAENQWSVFKLFSGITGLYELDGRYDAMNSIVKVFLLLCRWNLFLPNGIVAIFCDSSRPTKLWLLILFRAVVLGNIWVRIQSMLMIAILPLASISVLRSTIGTLLRRYDKTITAQSDRK